jgi:hypothetical protein
MNNRKLSSIECEVRVGSGYNLGIMTRNLTIKDDGRRFQNHFYFIFRYHHCVLCYLTHMSNHPETILQDRKKKVSRTIFF